MTNQNYPTIAHVLDVCFSVQAECSQDEGLDAYKTLLESKEYSDRLEGELRQAFGDPEFSWAYALANPDYEVTFSETEQQARDFARELLWRGRFHG
ncbi:MAG: hypothetical protein RL385_3785 [Pseudomonadota bacterium]|jgi:hypothetical protein